jgi:hypothetical protein
VGIVAPVFSAAAGVVLVAAMLFGGTVVGITAMVVAYAGRIGGAEAGG